MMINIGIRCTTCNEQVYMTVDERQFDRLSEWLYKDETERAPILVALPFLTADEGEMFLSRTCPSCREKALGDHRIKEEEK